MKKQFLKIGSLLMVLYMLLVAHGLNVNFHQCSANHHLMGSLSNASELCVHCLDHHHHERMCSHESEEHHEMMCIETKCCCEDFDSEVGFADHFTFSTDKNLMVYLPLTLLWGVFHVIVDEVPMPVFRSLTQEKTPYLQTGRLKTIFFSNMKLPMGNL